MFLSRLPSALSRAKNYGVFILLLRRSCGTMEGMNELPASKRGPRVAWLIFVLFACAHFSLDYLSRAPQFLNLRVYGLGTDRLPYQGRILMSWVLRSTAGSTWGAATLARITAHVPPPFNDAYLFVLLVTTFIGMVVAVLSTRATLVHLTGDRAFAAWASLLTLYMAYFNLLLVYGLTYTLPYDVPALAFFCVGVWLVMKRQYWLLIPVFVLGTLNRETFCFLTVFLGLHAWFELRDKDASPDVRRALFRVALPHVVLQAVLWVGLRLWVRHLLHDNVVEANGFFANQLARNLKFLVTPPQWPLLLSVCGFTIPLFVWGYKVIGDRAFARAVVILLGVWGGGDDDRGDHR